MTPADTPRRGSLELIVGDGSAQAAAIDKWLATARAQAALRGIEVHLLDLGEIVVTRGAFTDSVHSRPELALLLREMGCQLPEAPPP